MEWSGRKIDFAIGLLAGIFGGLVGLGGGIVMIPLMVGLKKISQHSAHGTSLVALVFTGIAGAATYALQGSVNFIASILLAATAVLTARTGAHLAHSLPEWKLKRSFGGFLIFVALMMVLKPYFSPLEGMTTGVSRAAVLLLSGAVTGLLSGMMGVGGGTIMVPAMVFLVGMGQHTAQGSSLLAMVPAGAAGAWTHGKLGNVEKELLPGLVPGILIGTYLGGSAAHLLSEATLRFVFAVVLLLTGRKYLKTPIPKLQ